MGTHYAQHSSIQYVCASLFVLASITNIITIIFMITIMIMLFLIYIPSRRRLIPVLTLSLPRISGAGGCDRPLWGTPQAQSVFDPNACSLKKEFRICSLGAERRKLISLTPHGTVQYILVLSSAA